MKRLLVVILLGGCGPKSASSAQEPISNTAAPSKPEPEPTYSDSLHGPDDSDGDGILDREDKCVHEPEDLDGFTDEDGCPDLDNEGDGILDIDDLCPNNGENFNGVQDDDGCPD